MIHVKHKGKLFSLAFVSNFFSFILCHVTWTHNHIVTEKHTDPPCAVL